MVVTPENQLAIWQQLIGTSPNLSEEYNKIKDELVKANDKNAAGRALQRVHTKFKKLTNSKAVSFTGMIIAKAESVDYNAYKWTKAKKIFDKDPGLAMAGEYDEKSGKLLFKTNEKGEPLDVTEFWPSGDQNKNYLKPIAKHAFTRYIDCVVSLTKPDDKNPSKADVARKGIITLKDQLADPNSEYYFDPPTGISVEFRALDKTGKEDDILKMNGAVVTKWSPSSVKMPSVIEVTNKYYGDSIITADKIVEAFEKKAKAFVIVEGFVMSMNREENQKTGNRMVTITSMEMDDAEGQKSITGWIPRHVAMDFGEESEIRILGMMDRRPVFEDGKPTGEIGEVTINVRSIQVLNKVDAPASVKDFDPSKFNNAPSGTTMPDNFMS